MEVGIGMSSGPLKIVFFGTPEYAVPALKAIAGDPRFSVQLVVTQPDRPVGRKRTLSAPAVKLTAESLGLTVFQPESLRTPEQRSALVEVDADLFVVAAYGLILGKKTLALPKYGSINLHASLLPAYRGASPVSAAIESGDVVTGVTMMEMDPGIDTGPIVSTWDCAIAPEDTTSSLTDRLSTIGADLLLRDLSAYALQEITSTPQPLEGASITRMLTKNDGWIDWSRSAAEIERFVRAMWSWPRAWTTIDGKRLQVHSAKTGPFDSHGATGSIRRNGESILVACGVGTLELIAVQEEGSNPVTANEWLSKFHDREIQLGLEGVPDSPGARIVRISA